jgi:tetratricopeptide (TPR) repeat protein
MKSSLKIIILSLVVLVACTGSKKYFKAAEKLERQGLVNEAAEFYLESLQRKPTNTDASIKLKEVGQKYVSFMSSEFFREYNIGQMESAIDNFERLKNFTGRAQALNVRLNYPTAYEEDYKVAIDKFCEKNYDVGAELVKQKKYSESLTYLNNVNKYKPEFKKNKLLRITAICEPQYQNVVTFIQGKNYSAALKILNSIQTITDAYKDSKDLYELCTSMEQKDLLMFQPKNPKYPEIVDLLFNSFTQNASAEHKSITMINNSPFIYLPGNNIDNNIDLIQGIRKASGADFFYVFDVTNKNGQYSGPSKTNAKAFMKVTFKKGDGTIGVEYKPVDYHSVKTKRSVSYLFSYKLVNAVTNQVVSFQNMTVTKTDEVNYNEFLSQPQANINDYYPYDPPATPVLQQYNPSAWRGLFTANKVLKSEQELEGLVNQETVKIFSQTLNNYVK